LRAPKCELEVDDQVFVSSDSKKIENKNILDKFPTIDELNVTKITRGMISKCEALSKPLSILRSDYIFLSQANAISVPLNVRGLILTKINIIGK
jgi:hypothetical protein